MFYAVSENMSSLTEAFRFHYESSKHDINPYHIHGLRVSVKKIRALIKMHQEINSENISTKIPLKNLRKTFKCAALLRDLHIISVIISENFSNLFVNKTFAKYFKVKEKKAVKNFIKSKKFEKYAYEELSYINSIFNKDKLIQNNLYNNKTDVLISQRLKAIKAILSDHPDDDQFHKFRIRLKELNHIMGLTNGTFGQELQEQLIFTAGVLGIWHDHIIFLDFFRTFIQSNKSYNKNIIFNKILNIENGYCLAEKERILTEAHNIFESV